jgi:ABC-type lipoprotein release transport system permease subunit
MEAAINAKGGVMNIFSVIILIIAGIGILNLLLMAVYERTREIGLVGCPGDETAADLVPLPFGRRHDGPVGLVFGVVLGLAINGILGQIGFDYSSFSTLTEYTALINGRVYPTLGLDKLLQRGLTVVIIATLAAYYPAREAAQSDPAQALQLRVRSAMTQLFKMAIRDLGRNRRRSFFSALALGMGLALLLLMASVIKGEMRGSMESSIRLQSGHIQVRAPSYDEDKTSLAWEDLIDNPDQIAAQIRSLAPVKVATPRLFASGILARATSRSGCALLASTRLRRPTRLPGGHAQWRIPVGRRPPGDPDRPAAGRKIEPGCGRPDRPVGQHFQRRCGPAALYHPGNLHHTHTRGTTRTPC